MGIYRGAGGTGDATQDASSQAFITVTAKDAALAAQAAAATSATNAATSATNAASSATSASGSATTATIQASNASTSATNAASSATSASGSASTATTQAGIATTQAGNAATSATAAATSATTASTQASNASTSASAASTSATNAATSATNAATSYTNTAAKYTLFHNQYQGSYSTSPSVRPDSSTLQTGDLYFNTTSSSMKVWNGTAWLDAYASLGSALVATNNLSDLNSASTSRTNLGLAIGTNVQAWDGDLDAIAAIVGTSGLLKKTAANTWSLDTNTYLTSVTGTAPVVSSGGTTPAISMAAATTSVSGYLTSTDWTTFNGKQAALVSNTNIKTVNSTTLLGSGDISVGVTSVTGTAPVVSSGGATPAISMAAATTSVSGYLTSTDWNTFNGKQASGSYVTVGGALGTPSSGTLTNCTFPTLNQNTTGSSASCTGNAATATTATNLSGGTVAATTITATGNITAYFSDDNLKTKLGKIENALDKVCSLEGFYYEANKTAQALGYKAIREVGVSAQSVQKIMPEIVSPAPIDPEKYLTVDYGKLTPMLIEAIKELRAEIELLKAR